MNRRLGIACVVLAMLVVAGPATVSPARIPSSLGSPPDWAAQKSNIYETGNGSAPAAVVVGDSLIDRPGPATFANGLRELSGHSAVVAASQGSSLSHWVTPALMGQLDAPTIQELSARAASGVVVMALGTNDARLLVADSQYTVADYVSSLNTAIDSSLASAACVVLVNTSTRAAQGHLTGRRDVNEQIGAVDRRTGRVRVADWDAYSSAQPRWFSSDYVHHTAEGSAAYRNFIVRETTAVFSAMAAGSSSPCTAPYVEPAPVVPTPVSPEPGPAPPSVDVAPLPRGQAPQLHNAMPKPAPSVWISNRSLVVKLAIRTGRGQRCPAKVTAKISGKGLKTMRATVPTRHNPGGCRVAKTIMLGSKARKLKSVKVVISGSGLRARTLTAKRRA